MDEFFSILEQLMGQHKFAADRIYNVDETGIRVVPSQMPKILGRKGKRQTGALTSAERGFLITCVMCMSAGGSFVPPLCAFLNDTRGEKWVQCV